MGAVPVFCDVSAGRQALCSQRPVPDLVGFWIRSRFSNPTILHGSNLSVSSIQIPKSEKTGHGMRRENWKGNPCLVEELEKKRGWV